jgi:hypothetical protein
MGCAGNITHRRTCSRARSVAHPKRMSDEGSGYMGSGHTSDDGNSGYLGSGHASDDGSGYLGSGHGSDDGSRYLGSGHGSDDGSGYFGSGGSADGSGYLGSDGNSDDGSCVLRDDSEEDANSGEAGESDEEDVGRIRLASRVLTSDGVAVRFGAKHQSSVNFGGGRDLQRDYSMLTPWSKLRKADGSLMFEYDEVKRGGNSLRLGGRIDRLLAERPGAEYPPTKQPAGVGNAAGWHEMQITRGPRIPVNACGHKEPGSVVDVLFLRLNAVRGQDIRSMRASCGQPSCPICRLPELQQPHEPLIWYDDLVYWWNSARGKCMGARCRQKLCFYRSIPEQKARKENGQHARADTWTIQRRNNKINHVPSNIIGVLCMVCNSTIAIPVCTANGHGTII